MIKPEKQKYKSKNKFNYDTKPVVFPLKLTQDLQIQSLQISQHGRSGGVIFIETAHGSFVLKANNEAARDFFFNQFALSLDVSVPMMQTIACYTKQFDQLVFKIQKYCQLDEVLYARLKTKLDFPFYEIMQYVPCISLTHCGCKKYMKNMRSIYKMYNIGMCLAYDIIINNNDRFSLLWRGEGNINNILIDIQNLSKVKIQQSRNRQNESAILGNYVFIDHDGHMINCDDKFAKSNADKYFEVVTQFHLNTIQYLRKQNSSIPSQFDKLVKQLQFFTQYKLNDEQLILICQGIIYTTKKFIDFYQSGDLEMLHKSIIKPVDTNKKQVNYWNQYWNNQFKNVNMNFCQILYTKISAIYITYPQLINQIYSKVKKIIQQNKNTNKRRLSDISRKNSQAVQKESEAQHDRDREQDEDNQKGDQNASEKNNKQSGSRKWRQKLIQFKQQNYH